MRYCLEGDIMPKVRVTKDDILNISFDMVRINGIDNLNARRIAKELNCSVQPIFFNFSNMDDLKKSVLIKCCDYFYEFVSNLFDEKIPPYKQVGINYIKFAKEEPNLFKLLFMSDNDLSMIENNKSVDIIKQYIGKSLPLSDFDIDSFHLKMWIFTQGLATLTLNNNLKLTDEQISSLLTNEFKALSLYEKNK